MRLFLRTTLVLLMAASTLHAKAGDDLPLLRQAQAANPARYQFAVDHGARIVPTPDGRSFYVLWLPRGADPASTPLIVSLHGHASWAFDEIFLWHDKAEEHGAGVLALQWWLGSGEGLHDYYTPQEMYPLLKRIVEELGTKPGNVLLHGFSRGAANVYALAFLDRREHSGLFGLVLANSGAAATGDGPRDAPPGYPLYVDITRGKYGNDVFAGSRFALFSGGRDPHPERDGIPAMKRTARWIEAFGGKVALTIFDERAGHGGFHQDPDHIEEVLKLFDQLRPRPVSSAR